MAALCNSANRVLEFFLNPFHSFARIKRIKSEAADGRTQLQDGIVS